MEKNIPCLNSNQRKSGVAILISDRADLKGRRVVRAKKGHYIIVRRSVIQEDITIFNVDAPNNRSSHYMKKNTDKTLKRNR